MQAFQRALFERFTAIPGARDVGATNVLPMRGGSGRYYAVVGEPAPEPGREPVAEVRLVAPGYFDAMGIAMEAGRAFTLADDEDAPPVVIVNPSFASRHWPDRNPLGQRVTFGGVEHEIVGLAADTRDYGPDEEALRLAYMPILQNEVRAFSLVVHTAADPASTANAVREAVTGIDPRQPVYDLTTMAAILSDSIGGSLAMAKVLGALAFIAFLLAAVGVYGVMAYAVAQRTQELGIRMALGAQPRDVLRLILRRGAFLTGTGVLIGLAISFGVTRLLAFFLYGVSPFDPIAFVSVPIVLGLTGLVASFVPALRASGVDPLISLRTPG